MEDEVVDGNRTKLSDCSMLRIGNWLLVKLQQEAHYGLEWIDLF